MNSPNPDGVRASGLLAGLETWFESVRTGTGFGGPSVGVRRSSPRFCGAGFDWRWEGLLDGWGTRLRATGDTGYADRMKAGLEAIRGAQLPDGVFRNSHFDHNPFEGGMPHEPILLAAVCRARRTLTEAGHPVPEGIDAMLERYVEGHLIKELWSKQLRTFNDWLQSDFEYYTVHAVAAAVDLLFEYGDLSGTGARCAPFIEGALNSLLALQVAEGDMRGALPVSNRRGDSAAPAYAARCLPVLDAAHRRLANAACATARDALADFLLRYRRSDGGYPPHVFPTRPPSECPILYGGGAGITHALLRVGRGADARADVEIERLAAARRPSGGMDTARGFGQRTPDFAGPPDWRDVVPVGGWCDKAYAFLADVSAGPAQDFTPGPFELAVTVRGREAVFRETGEALAIEGPGGTPLYRWTKGAQWAEVCRL